MYLPKHPDSDPKTGLYEILAVPSPRYFSRFPQFDFEAIHLKGEDGKSKWQRGYSSFFKALCRMRNPMTGGRFLNRRKAEAICPGSMDTKNLAWLRVKLREATYSEEYKTYKKVWEPTQRKMKLPPPNGGQRETSTLYSLPFAS
jgi:hypothetical protein